MKEGFLTASIANFTCEFECFLLHWQHVVKQTCSHNKVSYVSKVKALFVSRVSVVSLWFCDWIMHAKQRIIAHHCSYAESLSVQGSLLWLKCSRSSKKYNICVLNVSTAARVHVDKGWKKYPALLLIYLSHLLMFWLSSAVQHSQAQHLSHT